METALHSVQGIAVAVWDVVLESGIYLMLGFFFAALVGAFVRNETIARYMGGNRFKSVLNASLFGIPIPLCSCGVISAATGLRKQGASRGATLSFLTSTPQTGLDSISISWALLGPFLTLVRVVSAFVTALLAGWVEILFGEKESGNSEKPRSLAGYGPSLKTRIRMSLKSTFGMIFDDILTALWIGLILSGVIAYFVSPRLVESLLGSGWWAMPLALLAGLPLYICAVASTPVVATLLAAGMSPGAAVVFLLAGPATNAATMTVVAQQLGRRSLAIYLGSIVVCSLALGWTANALFAATGWSPVAYTGGHEHGGHSIIHWIGALALVGWSAKLYFDRWRKSRMPAASQQAATSSCCSSAQPSEESDAERSSCCGGN